MNKQDIYLDLSKLTPEQQRQAIEIVPKSEDNCEDDFFILETHSYLHVYNNDINHWWVSGSDFIRNKSEITFSQFMDLFKYPNLTELEKEMMEMLERLTATLTDIDRTLFHHNHSVVGWHLNGDLEPIMNFVSDFDMDSLSESSKLIEKVKAK